jgi:predicted GIY-YIG superfamily endonuclease
VELVFSLGDLSYRSAREVEQYIKPLSRARKKALIAHEPGMMALVEERIH